MLLLYLCVCRLVLYLTIRLFLAVLVIFSHIVLFLIRSGGNKRKLSTAIALVGNPPIVFLVSGTVYHQVFFSVKFVLCSITASLDIHSQVLSITLYTCIEIET